MTILDIYSAILNIAEEKKYSDVHMNTGNFPILRDSSGDIISVEKLNLNGEELQLQILTDEDVLEVIKHVLGEENFKIYTEKFELDGSYQHSSSARYRINCYKDSNGSSIALRSIPEDIPSLESLGLGEQVKMMCRKSKGLILITGPTGTGKSTNLAGMIDYINTNYKKHIITIEDPIEFVFKNKLSLINQREVGIHTESFASAMKASLREDPDIIMIGEMRDPETIKAAITLAETGHLVFSTLHTNDTVQSIDRIVDVFPSGQQEQIRMQLAMSLVGVIAQRLVPRADKDERIAIREVLLSNDAVRNLIISGNTHQLYSIIEIGQKQGMILMDNYLIALYKKGLITKETLESYVRDKENIDIITGQ
ncbi:PilT/PilU family type 4a pilus ATPase [Candidatus Gracilibacteria bacterium]|nr:PilT/PilU family type 4a pilus ATPase [Candidatus Gracilibacteria bacterium]